MLSINASRLLILTMSEERRNSFIRVVGILCSQIKVFAAAYSQTATMLSCDFVLLWCVVIGKPAKEVVGAVVVEANRDFRPNVITVYILIFD